MGPGGHQAAPAETNVLSIRYMLEGGGGVNGAVYIAFTRSRQRNAGQQGGARCGKAVGLPRRAVSDLGRAGAFASVPSDITISSVA